MARIKKQGLDYFPLDTNFVHDRIVRRIMKREGDGALAVLLNVLSCIYAERGYYVEIDNYFYDDISTNFFEKSADDVKRIVALAVEYDLFDADLFVRYGVLTSINIQQQYLFSTKCRKHTAIDPKLCLIPHSQADEATPKEEAACTNEGINVTFMPQNVTSGTHSIAQHSIAQHSTSKHSIKSPLLKSSPKGDPEVEELRREEAYFCDEPEAEKPVIGPDVPMKAVRGVVKALDVSQSISAPPTGGSTAPYRQQTGYESAIHPKEKGCVHRRRLTPLPPDLITRKVALKIANFHPINSLASVLPTGLSPSFRRQSATTNVALSQHLPRWLEAA